MLLLTLLFLSVIFVPDGVSADSSEDLRDYHQLFGTGRTGTLERRLEAECPYARTFFYKTEFHLEVLGPTRPECDESELVEMGETLSLEFSQVVKLHDSRMPFLYQLDSKVCSKLPTQEEDDRRLSTTNREESEENNSNSVVDEEIVDERRKGQSRRQLGFSWITFDDRDHQRYLFDYNGIGDCRFCPVQSSTPSKVRHLRSRKAARDKRVQDNVMETAATRDEYAQISDVKSQPSHDELFDRSREEIKSDDSNSTDGSTMHLEQDQRRLKFGPMEVTSFSLYDTTKSPPRRIRTLEDFDILDKVEFGPGASIVAETQGKIGSVWFDYDSSGNMHGEVTGAPYSIGGKDAAGRLDAFSALQEIGTHTLSARPYSSKGRKSPTGKPGKGLTKSFLVIDSSKFEDEDTNIPDSSVIDALEEDVSFHLSKTFNQKYFFLRGHCLRFHMIYIHVDITDVRGDDEHSCSDDDSDDD